MLGRLVSLTVVGAVIGGGVVAYRRLRGIGDKAAILNRVDTGSVW